jgi:hypothetical protein
MSHASKGATNLTLLLLKVWRERVHGQEYLLMWLIIASCSSRLILLVYII